MQNSLKVLVFSKDISFLNSIKECFEGESHHVVHLVDIAQLVQTVYDEMPHLVLVEARLSNVGAFDLCREMKTDAVLEHIPLIFVTDTARKGEVMDCGADLYLQKNEKPATIKERIQSTLKGAHYELDINPLTRFPGNRSSIEKIESMISEKDESIEICSIHLRDFSAFYKKFGVHQGDYFFREVSGIIKRVMEDMRNKAKDCFVGHFGIHDFVVMLPTGNAIEFSERLIEEFEKLTKRVEESAKNFGSDGMVTMSIAILENTNTKFRHISEISRAFDQIHHYLLRYKHSSYLHNRRLANRESESDIPSESRIFQSSTKRKYVDIQRSIGPSQQLLSDVIYFLKSEAVDTYFQPIVDFNGKIFAYEALARFRKPDGTFVEPIRMFQACREVNLIKEFDVLCAITALKNANDKLPEGCKLFINLNRETLLDPSALNQIWQLSSWDPSRLVVEITEQSLLREIERLAESIHELRKNGIQAALDDAGGGSVSLREAAELKLNYIKFDKSLVQEVATSEIKQKILMSLLVFSRSIGAETIAEGIETVADWHYLKNIGITYGQGYLLAKPAPDPTLKISGMFL